MEITLQTASVEEPASTVVTITNQLDPEDTESINVTILDTINPEGAELVFLQALDEDIDGINGLTGTNSIVTSPDGNNC